MNRVNIFYFSKMKKANDLTKQMETIEVEHQRSKLKKIISERKNKWRQIMSNKQIVQPSLNYLKKNYDKFSFVESNASKQPFINENKKMRNWISNRAFSSSPNIKVGSPHKNANNQQQMEDRIVLNRKFQEYDKLIDKYSPLKKIQQLQKRRQKNMYALPRNRVTQMKRTFFQKFIPDKFNFYTINDYGSIKSTILSHSKTDNEIKCQRQITSKLRHASSTTIQSQTKDKQYVTLNNSVLNKSKLKNKRLSQFESFKSQSKARSRIRSQQSDNLIPISFQKNLDSIYN